MVDQAWKSYLENTEVVIHAGGISERWHPVTQGKIPKALTKIGKTPRPIIDWTMLPYVKAGIKKIFVSLWHDPEKIIQHCKTISEKSGIEFVFLIEWEKRLGRAGVMKHYLENGTLDAKKNKITAGGSDIVNVNLEEFSKFQTEGLNQGFLATLIGSYTGMAQFDRIMTEGDMNRVVKVEGERIMKLPPNEFANTGTAFFDAKLNQVFLKIDESQLPLDWENMGKELFGKAHCLGTAKMFKDWYPLKTPYDYKNAKDVDFEKLLGIESAEKYLGTYSP